MTVFRTIKHQIRHLLIALQRVIQYVAQAVTKIFAPTNDQYPAIGVQPFTGESADKKKQNH
ncbi:MULTISPECIES: hypothetical protein [unclassified Nostoc]|uniref:hypothetical protein n=1 Tax=unclassified Nostoc TaxID=2593658 RepID=UPI0025D13D7A|nr:hypothetical protein [Nostoc sp. JL23]